MNKLIALAALSLSTLAAHAEYNQVNMTVFGMDCAPCAHAIHVSMKGIQGVNKVDVDLNTGLVSIQLEIGNGAAMQQFNQAVEKNGFTHKDAKIVAKGKITGTADAPVFEVAGTNDRYSLTGSGTNVSSLLGKTVSISGTLPQAPKGKVPDTLKYDSISEAK
ncbi:heavy-metal-associated domain-containing protein [Terriglobus aquaticus]|uniref:Heavy-metal-associated domain-containing protein n=1 Tax=Terriglobus aquaticus TaxID=940139 RepID=A0ABW9KR15_9BACT